jgi:hypothetical protein
MHLFERFRDVPSAGLNGQSAHTEHLPADAHLRDAVRELGA